MITLLGGFHAIAAARGDGLHPELLKTIASSQASAGIERTSGIAIIDGFGARSIDEVQRHV